MNATVKMDMEDAQVKIDLALEALKECYEVFNMDEVDTSLSLKVGMAIEKLGGGLSNMKMYRERQLPDSYPVYEGRLYVAVNNGVEEVIKSPATGSVYWLKKTLGLDDLKNCDIAGRGVLHMVD